jgi:hypothetical protein
VRSWLIIGFVVCATGCAENRNFFRPTEHVYGSTVHGYDEAIYQLVGAVGPFGEAKVWSSGAFRKDGQNVLNVHLDLHNTSGVPIVVDPKQVRLDPVRIGAQLLRNIPPVEPQPVAIAPGGFGHVKLHFILPPDTRPGRISSFGLRWQAQNGPQAYSQLTPFTEERNSYAYPYAPTYGYGYGVYCTPYDPFCVRGPYGLGAPSPTVIESGPPRATVRVR